MSSIAALNVPVKHSVIDQVRGLLPEIAARADEIEAGCAVPLDLLDKVADTGAFRMCLPASYGGEQLMLGAACQVISEIASVDASVAWHLMVAAGSQVITSRLPVATLDKYYAGGPDTWPKGAFSPKGIATPVEGGYRLSGRWPLASGARDYDWVGLGFLIRDEHGIRKSPDGKMPDMRFCVIPREGSRIIPTWDAVGLRGTRSDDIEVKDVFVPEAWQASFFGKSSVQAPILGIRMPFATGPHHNAVVMGLLRGAIKDLAGAAHTRRPAFNPTLLMKDDPVFCNRFGELAARVDSIGAYADQSIGILENCDKERRDVTPTEGARLAASVTLIHHDGAAVMDEILSLSGSGALYMSNRQQRRWRDLRCVAQHQAANISFYSEYAASVIAREVPVSPTTP
jgi:alkylation response protein AidB-like acyl-CoA dehydrogenase